MSWGLNINNVRLPRVTKDRLADTRDDATDTKRNLRERLLVLAASSPHVVRVEEGETEEWVDYVLREVGNITEELEEAAVTEFLCNVALGNPEDVTED